MTSEKKVSPGNIHILSDETIKTFEDKYDVSYHGDFLLFRLKYQNYTRAYETKKKFNVMNNDKVKMTVSPSTVEIWHSKFPESSLFRVQNTINKLTMKKQEITEEAIKEEMNK